MEKRQLSIALGLILSLLSIIIIFVLTFDRNSLEAIKRIQIQWFLLAISLHFLSWIIWGLRISVMSGHMNRELKLSLRESTEIALANLFLAAITPSMAGGEPVRIHLLSKKGFGVGKSTALVLGERVFDAMFVLSMIPISLWVFSVYIESELIRFGLVVGLTLFFVGIALFAFSIIKPDSVKRIIKSMIKRVKIKKVEERLEDIFEKIDGFIEGFHRGAKDIFKRENKLGILLISLLTASYWFVEFLIPSCILKGLNQDSIILQSISAQVLLMIIVMIPLTPGSSGIAEGGAALLYSAIIPNNSILGILILTWRFITYHINIIVGGVFQYKLFKSLASKK